MNSYTIDHIHKQFSRHSGAEISIVIGKNPLSRLFIAFAASLILIGCGSSGSDAPTVIQGEINTPVERLLEHVMRPAALLESIAIRLITQWI